jgi:hypothetical protein
VKALKDGETAKDWKNHVNTNSDHRPPKADKPEHKRKTHDKKDKGGKYEKKYKARASKIEQLEQMHTDLLARLEKGCGGRCGWLWELPWGCFSFSGVLGRWLVVGGGALSRRAVGRVSRRGPGSCKRLAAAPGLRLE